MVGGKRSIVKADSRSVITCREIPEEILVEILVRLPADSLMRFKCVSKIWSSLISSRYFTNLFYKFSSSKREGRVFVYADDDEDECMLFSSSLSNMDSTDSFLQLNHDPTLLGMKEEDDLDLDFVNLDFVNAIKGLICFSVSTGIRIINFTTRQILSLPVVKPRIKSNMSGMIHEWKYLGYDRVNDEYKVLNVFSDVEFFEVSKGNYDRRVISETRVLVLGAGASWRNTKINTSPPFPHSPHEPGISINGVLYYVALVSHEERYVVMSFDLNSEEFNLIKFPMEVHYQKSLMNYQDHVTVIDDSRLYSTECILDLWVLEDASKSKCSHKFFGFPYHELRLGINIDHLSIKGTNCRGEIWLSEKYGNRRNKKSTLAVYDVEKNRIMRRFVIEPPCPKFWIYNLWEDVESIIYLEA